MLSPEILAKPEYQALVRFKRELTAQNVVTDENFFAYVLGTPFTGYVNIFCTRPEKGPGNHCSLDYPLEGHDPQKHFITQMLDENAEVFKKHGLDTDPYDYDGGANLYFNPVVRAEYGYGLRSGLFNIAHGLVLVADYDCHEKDQELPGVKDIPLGRLPRPSVIVFSGRGYHCYWKSAKPLTPEHLDVYYAKLRHELANINATLPENSGNWDIDVSQPNHCARIPGSTNQKNGKRCTVVDGGTKESYDFDSDIFPFAATKDAPAVTKKATAKKEVGESAKRYFFVPDNPKREIETLASREPFNREYFPNTVSYKKKCFGAYYYIQKMPVVRRERNAALTRLAMLLRNDFGLSNGVAWLLYLWFDQHRVQKTITPENFDETEDEWAKMCDSFDNGLKYAKNEQFIKGGKK